MTTPNAENLDAWIRQDFREINTHLEELYFAQDNPFDVDGQGCELKKELLTKGGEHIFKLLNEGNTDEGFDNGFELLGNVGFFMAACRRHQIDQVNINNQDKIMRNTSALSMQLGASLGVVPRFASAHLETHNSAKNGIYKSFTSLAEETLFLEYNTRGVFSFIQASNALISSLPLGVSHPVTYDLLLTAKAALEDVVSNNDLLFNKLDTDRFFYNVRPYYKSHNVGLREYRGANAGDFAGINVVDLLLGLCSANDPYYSQLLVDKFLFMRPEDQLNLRDCMRRTSLMDDFLACLKRGENNQQWYQRNLSVFIQVCQAHGQTALQHHTMLVKKFIENPAQKAQLANHKELTASGPPLDVLLRSLKKLCDLRMAANVKNILSRFDDLERLKDSLTTNPA